MSSSMRIFSSFGPRRKKDKTKNLDTFYLQNVLKKLQAKFTLTIYFHCNHYLTNLRIRQACTWGTSFHLSFLYIYVLFDYYARSWWKQYLVPLDYVRRTEVTIALISRDPLYHKTHLILSRIFLRFATSLSVMNILKPNKN